MERRTLSGDALGTPRKGSAKSGPGDDGQGGEYQCQIDACFKAASAGERPAQRGGRLEAYKDLVDKRKGGGITGKGDVSAVDTRGKNEVVGSEMSQLREVTAFLVEYVQLPARLGAALAVLGNKENIFAAHAGAVHRQF